MSHKIDQDIICFNQSLRILSNLVAASAINYSGVLNEIISELLSATASLANLKLADGNDLIAKVFFLVLLQCILIILSLVYYYRHINS